jgi:hypothetical protein
MLPVLPRIPDVSDMIDGKFYFILHAPRQSGKTTFMQTLTNKINTDGNYYALNCSLASLKGVSDKSEAINTLADLLNDSVLVSEQTSLKKLAFPDDAIPHSGPAVKIKKFLRHLSVNLDKDLVVFFDEADCLTGPALVTFLAQIRDGYLERHLSAKTKFPSSLALVGMRDIRDYLVQVRPEEQTASLASPFNIKKESFTLANFTQDEIKYLYTQHTAASGQVFSDGAIEQAWLWTQGQPWLVNALASEAVVKHLKNDYTKTVSGEIIDQAARSIIVRNDNHFDSLRERLKEPRVRRVMEAVVAGAEDFPIGVSEDDKRYAVDLGLLKVEAGRNGFEVYRPANPIYQETIARGLASLIKLKPSDKLEKNRWMDGTDLDMNGLMEEFQAYWRQNSEFFTKKNEIVSSIEYSISNAIQQYVNTDKLDLINKNVVNTIRNNLIELTNEALPHLVLYAFLQRVLNGGADFIQREYALGLRRADICISYKKRFYPLEIKVKDVKSQAVKLKQLYSYMDKCNASEGWLLAVDRDVSKSWDQKISKEIKRYRGKTVYIYGC